VNTRLVARRCCTSCCAVTETIGTEAEYGWRLSASVQSCTVPRLDAMLVIWHLVVSPVLSNIYLDRLDQYVEQRLLPEYNLGRRRRTNRALRLPNISSVLVTPCRRHRPRPVPVENAAIRLTWAIVSSDDLRSCLFHSSTGSLSRCCPGLPCSLDRQRQRTPRYSPYGTSVSGQFRFPAGGHLPGRYLAVPRMR
jgi:hypothetical protein